jgi:hypothetical protein
MPKLKVDDNEMNVKELEDAEFNEDGGGQYEDYDGEQPPKGTLLGGYLKKVWWTYTQEREVNGETVGGDPMLKVLFVASENTGEEDEFNGCPVWDNIPLTPGAKFKWAPLFRVLGLTIRDVKTKTFVAEDDDNVGAPVEKIGEWQPGEESDSAWLRIVTGRHKFNGSWQTDPDKWLDYEEPEEDEPEEEPEEEPAKPARGGRRAKPAAETKAAPSRPATRGRRASASDNGDTKAAKPAARGRGRKPADDDPPF